MMRHLYSKKPFDKTLIKMIKSNILPAFPCHPSAGAGVELIVIQQSFRDNSLKTYEMFTHLGDVNKTSHLGPLNFLESWQL